MGVDREKVIKALELCAEGHHCHECSYQPVKHNLDGIADCTSLLADHALSLLKEQDNCENCAIAIEDRQPVIRCKDCHYRNLKERPILCQVMSDDWFCADGRRKDE